MPVLRFFFQSLVENAIGPIITTMALIIVFLILSAIPVDLIQAIRPYLFTNYLLDWRLFFTDPVEISETFKVFININCTYYIVLSTITYLYLIEKIFLHNRG